MKDAQYFSTAAQVIPVFALALVIEYRYFREDESESVSRSLFLISFLIALAGGEFIALTAIADAAKPTSFDHLLVGAALSWGLLGLFVPLLMPRIRALERLVSPRTAYRAKTVALMLFVALGVAAALVSEAIVGAAFAALWFVALVGSWYVERSELREGANGKSVSRAVSRTEPLPAERSATERD